MLSSLLSLVALAAGATGPATDFSPAVLDRAYARVSPAVCVLSYSYEVTNPNTGDRTRQDAQSLGLVVSAGGLVMARGHMALDNVEPFNIRVQVGRGGGSKEYGVALLKKPANVNVVLMQIQSDTPLQLEAVAFSREHAPKLGDRLAIFGLLGPALDYNPAFVVRRIGSVLDGPRATYCLDEPVAPGFVGGPVVDTEGRVLGVVGYDLSPAEGGDLYVRSGHPLVFPAELFEHYINAPPEVKGANAGEEDAWLGVFTQPLTDDLADYWGLAKDGGAVVSTVVPGSPAETGGIERGDVIVSFQGQPVRIKQDREVYGFTKRIRDAGVGKKVTLGVLRGGKSRELAVTLAAQPKAARDATEFKDDVFGLTVRELTTDVRLMLNLTADVQGVIVRRVESGSWSAIAGIGPGVVIMGFGERPITGLDDFKKAVAQLAAEKPQEVPVFARRGQRTGFFRIEPRWSHDTN